MLKRVFISGGTGYVGKQLIRLLQERRHHALVLARPQSARNLPSGCEIIIGDALNGRTFSEHVRGADTFVHLVGTPHPAPWKGSQFRAVDLVSVRSSVEAAKGTGITHFIYVSVAHPAPVMKAYIAVRTECESLIRASGLTATILRPWYILGPGHYWPYLLLPLYWLMERVPSTSESAQRLGLVTIRQIVNTLVWAVEHPPETTRVIAVPEIRRLGMGGQ